MPPKAAAPAGGDAPPKKEEKREEGKDRKKKVEHEEPEPITKTPSQIAAEEAEQRALMRKNRFKRKWPEISKPKLNLRPWRPPPPPQKLPPVMIELPELVISRRWVPPYRRRRRQRPRLMRIPAEEMHKPAADGFPSHLNKIWHNFSQIERNKMIIQGSIGCDSKRYSSTTGGSQTGCIAVVCRALLEEREPSQLRRCDVNDCIAVGDNFYKRCLLAMKCYKGKPQLQLNQLLTSFYLHDTKYTVKMVEVDRGLLAKHPDNIQAEPDLMALMEKRTGQTYTMILTIGGTRHFLIWGHPPTEAGACKTIAYIFDPHMLDMYGRPNRLGIGGAFIRYAGITSFVLDFLANYGNLDAAKKGTPKPQLTLTNIDVVQKEPLERVPTYDLDMKALKIHCDAEWNVMNVNALIEKKRNEGKYPLASLSAVSLATSRATDRKKVKDFYQKTPKDPAPTLPVAPEKAPAGPTTEQLMSLRGEDFFLYCPKTDGHTYGRDDMIPRPKSETVLHSPVEIADKNYHSQYQKLDPDRYILRGTRHMASYRYQTFKSFTGVACCVAALAMLGRLRARGWNEDTVDETLDLGFNLFRESLMERTGPIRRLVLGELRETIRIRDQEYTHKERGIAVWGKMISSNAKVFDLCRGLDAFFKEADTGILQIPGEFEAAIWNEGGKYYLYHPWPADNFGKKVGLQDGGKACVMYFTKVVQLCDHLLAALSSMSRRPFSISDVGITKRASDIPPAINNLLPVAPGRWVNRGSFHEGDTRFQEEHRNKQATPMSIMALAMTYVRDPDDWTPQDIDEILTRGDTLYQNTMDHLERMGISLETPKAEEDKDEGEEEESGPAGTLAAADVLNKFTVTDVDCIETEVNDSAYNGSLNPEPDSGLLTLKDALKNMFKSHTQGVITARGGSRAIWRSQDQYYMFEPHGCDENGYPCEDLPPRSAACVIKVSGGIPALADAILSNLAPGSDDSFNISPVTISHAKLNPDLDAPETKLEVYSNLAPGSDDSFNIFPVTISHAKLNPDLDAPETKLESKAFEWISKGTAAIMMGPRGENTAIGKCAKKAGIGEDDMAGRALALPAAAAFVAATESVPPQYMHQDHMYNFLDAGTDYYMNHVKKTGRKDIQPEDLTEKFAMGANTFSIELGEPIRLPLRLPDEPAGEGEEEGGGGGAGEEGEEEEGEPPMKQIKDALFKMWRDHSKPATVAILHGDYHQLGLWLAPGGKLVAFDPAPTLTDDSVFKPSLEIKDALFKMWRDHSKPATVAILHGDYHQLGLWLAPGGKLVAFDPAPTLTDDSVFKPSLEIKDALFKMWRDHSKPATVAILHGDYHQLGLWLAPGGKLVAFDPAPTLTKGLLTPQRIKKGDEIRLQRIKDEMAGEGGDAADEEDEEAGGEGEAQPEPEPEFVPPESCPALMVFASPGEFIDKLTLQGGLDRKQCLAPYKLYPVKITNELTSVLKEKKPAAAKTEEEAGDEEEEEALVDPLEDEAMGSHYTRLSRTTASVRGRVAQAENYFMDSQRDLQDAANAAMGIVVEHVEPYTFWKPSLIDAILKYGDRLYTLSLPNASEPPVLKPKEIAKEFHVTNFNIRLEMEPDVVSGDLNAGETGSVLNLTRAIKKFFEQYNYGILCAKNYCVGLWKGSGDKAFVVWEPHSVGPAGKSSLGGAAGAILFSMPELIAETFADNVKALARPGGNKFSLTSVKVFWEFSKTAQGVTVQGSVPDEGYEWKVLTAYVETARGRTILRGTRPPDLVKFTRDALLQSSCGAIVAACMSHVRRPHLWTRNTVDEVMSVGCKLFAASLGSLGYEFRPGEDLLLPLQVLKRFILGVNYVRYEIDQVYTGKLEQKEPSAMTVRSALERFFESHTHGILWSAPHAAAVWRVQAAPPFYMMEPHACGPTGLRIDAQDDGAACVLTFTSAKLMAFAYLQNVPVTERPKHDFQLYAISVTVAPIKKLGGVEPPLVRAPPGVKLVPATSKVGLDGGKRRADERDRKHPPGAATCLDAQRAADRRDKDEDKLKGQRNTSGWLVLTDGTQFLSAQHSMACKKFPYASRGNQAVSCCVMSVAMSRVQDVCRWCSSTLDQVLESGDQLHQDSYLHFKPKEKILGIEQILRKFYTPGNCVCRVVVYQARHQGVVDSDLLQQVTEFFREEKSGVFIAGKGDFAVALFRTPRGYYMFDPADRDRYGRAVAPPCVGKARACFSQYPNVTSLVEKLGPNIPPVTAEPDDKKEVKVIKDIGGSQEMKTKEEKDDEKEVHFEEPAHFSIYGMDVTSLRRLNQHEK